jgi:hypothetical protein
MKSPKPKSIALSSSQPRVYRTFEDWQADQERDNRSPEERGIRGIRVGSSVMWRHREDRIVYTDRATVLEISKDTLTILVKGQQERTLKVPLNSIVVNEDDRTAR